MDVYEAIDKRFSVRKYKDKPIEDDKLLRVLEAGRSAPSANNRQEWKLIVVRDAELRAAVGAATGQPFVGQAPVIVAVVGLTPDAVMVCKVPTDPVDCAIVIDHVTLSAVAEGTRHVLDRELRPGRLLQYPGRAAFGEDHPTAADGIPRRRSARKEAKADRAGRLLRQLFLIGRVPWLGVVAAVFAATLRAF